MPDTVIVRCKEGHRFAVLLSGHPAKDGKPRCPYCMVREIITLQDKVTELSACGTLQTLLPELDEALEDLELFGLHSDQGYRKLREWYRQMLTATANIDAVKRDDQ